MGLSSIADQSAVVAAVLIVVAVLALAAFAAVRVWRFLRARWFRSVIRDAVSPIAPEGVLAVVDALRKNGSEGGVA